MCILGTNIVLKVNYISEKIKKKQNLNAVLIHCFSVMSSSLQSQEWQHARLLHPTLSPGVNSNSCPLSLWCHPIISSSVASFSSCSDSFPASGSIPVSRLFTSCGQSIGASASAPVFPVNIQGWFPLGWTALISLLSKGLLRVFSNTTVWKH